MKPDESKPSDLIKVRSRIRLIKLRHNIQRNLINKVNLGRRAAGSALAAAFGIVLVVTVLFAQSSPSTAATLTLSNTDITSGTRQYGTIDRTSSSIALQKGVVGSWSNTNNLQVMPTNVNGTSNLAYGPNDTVYLMTSFSNNCYFQKYDIERQQWEALRSPPQGCGLGNTLSFDKVGSFYYTPGSSTNDFYRYDIADDSWHRMGDFPSTIGEISSAQFVTQGANQYLYLFRGLSSPSFWRYTVASNTWDARTPFPTSSNVNNGIPMTWDGGDYIYALSNDVGEYRRYSISTNSWTNLTNLANSCYRNGLQYVAGKVITMRLYWCGETENTKVYNVASATWSDLTPPPAPANNYDFPPPTTYDGSRYIYTMYGSELRPQMFRFDTTTSSWDTSSLFTSQTDNSMYHYKVMWDGSTGAYWTGGTYSGAFDRTYKYDLTSKTSSQIGAQVTTQSGYSGVISGNAIYALPNTGLTTFQKFDLSTHSWTALADMPFTSGVGGDLVDGGDGNLYVEFGQKTNFYKYNIAANTWTSLTSMLQSPSSGGGITRVGTKIYVLVGGQTAYMMQYDMSANTWSYILGMPEGAIDYGGFITGDNSRYLYVGMSSRTDVTAKKVYRFDTTTSTWQRIADLPASTVPFASAFYDTTANKLYVAQGQNSSQLWSWTPNAAAYVTAGAWISRTFDLKQVQAWTSLTATVTGTGTTTFMTRTSSNGKIWTPWAATSGTTVNSPVNRYLQIKVNLTGDGTATPTVSNISVQHTQETAAPSLPAQFNSYGSKGGSAITSGTTYEYTHPYFNWSASDDGSNGSGVAGYYVYFGTNSGADPTTAGTFQTTTDYTVTNPMVAGDITYLRIAVKDNLGNISAPATFFSYRYFYISPPGQILKTSDSDFSDGTNTNVAAGGGSMSLVQQTNGVWSTGPLAMTPENTRGSAEAVVGDNLYVARGAGTQDFYRYNTVNQKWDALATVPATVNIGSSITYDGTNNLYLMRGGSTNSFFKYDIQNNQWTTLVSLPTNAQQGSDIKFIGGNTFAVFFSGVREFYFWDRTTGIFTNKTAYPYSISNAGSGIWWDGGDNIYAFLGGTEWYNDRGRTNMVKYSISNDAWRTLANAPIESTYVQNNLVADGHGGLYIMTPNTSDDLNKNQRMMRYDLADDSWSEVRGLQNQPQWGSMTSDGSRYIYILPSEDNNVRKMLRYDTIDNEWTPTSPGPNSLDRIPWDSHTNAYSWMGGNATTAAYDGTKWMWAIGASEGNFSRFIKYDPKTGETINMPPPPQVGVSGSMSYVGGSLYYMPGRSTTDFYKFDESSVGWLRMATVPVSVYRPGATGLIAVGGNLYAFSGNNSNFYKYTPNAGTGTWASVASAPGTILNGSMVLDSTNNYIYVVAGNGGSGFYRYNITGNSWSSLAALPASSTYGNTASLNNGKIYVQRGNTTKTAYIYDIASNTWSNNADAPEQYRYGAMSINMGTYSVNLAADGSPDVWQYIFPAANTAYNGLGVHVSQPMPIAGIFDYADITAQATVPANTKVELYTRTSADSNTWDNWIRADQIKTNSTSITGRVGSTVRKYIQIKVVMTSLDNVSTPTVNSYALDYYFDVDPPSNPTTIKVFQDNTKAVEVPNNTWVNYTAPTFDWPDPGQSGGATDGPLGSHIAGYWIYVGTDPTASPRTAGTFVTASEYTPTLSISGSYYVRMQTQDFAGNVDGTIFAPYTYKFDNTPPTNPALISANPSGYTTHNNFSFSWPAAYDGDSGVAGYCYHSGATSGAFAAETCQTGTSLDNVSAAYQNGTNVFYIRTYDVAGNFSPSYTTVSYYYSTNPPGPVTNLRAIPPSSSENLFTFTWDLPAVFAGDPDQLTYCYSINELPTALNTTCTPNRYIAPFKAATQQGTNIIYMVAKDEANNADWTSFAYSNFIANTVSPGIPLNVVASDTSDRSSSRWSLTLTWDAPTFVGNGIKSYIVERSDDGNKFTEIGTTSSTAYVDIGVTPNTDYYYRIRAADAVDNRGGASGIVSKQAKGSYGTPPEYVVLPTALADSNQAEIKWATSRASSSFVYYGTSPSDLSQSKGSLDVSTAHTQTVAGLAPSTTYFYRVQSFDNDRSYNLADAYSQIYSFKTAEAARMFNVTSDSATLSSVLLSWQTSVPTKGRIAYGTSSAYDLSADDGDQYVSMHNFKLTSLTAGTTYHFRITGTTSLGATINSDDYTFSTLARPSISNVRFNAIDTETAAAVEVTWHTNVPTSSTLKYSAQGVSAEQSLGDLTMDHSVTLHNLASSSDYTFNVEGRDGYGNLVTSDAQHWRSSVDTRAPVISGSSVSVTTIEGSNGQQAQMIVVWQTDEPATTQVTYGRYADKRMDNFTPLDTEPTTNHVAIVSGLNLADIYQVQFISKDLNGNTAYSSKTLVVTPDKEESLLDSTLNLLLKVFRF